MNILIVLTSHETMGNTGRHTGFWLEEFATPYYIFKDSGAQITLASPKGGLPPIDPTSEQDEYQSASTVRFKSDEAGQTFLANTCSLDQISTEEFDAVFYPGGHGPLWDLVDNTYSIQIIETMFAASKPVSAICHGPCVFKNANRQDGSPIVQNKNVTCFTNSEEEAVQLSSVVPFLVEDMLRENGANFSYANNFEYHCVQDRNLITGQNPASSTQLANAVLEQLA